jgi:protein-S-isoprenylcysteine O-methyltransferase Ste14
MSADEPFRTVLIIAWLTLLPVMIYHRVRSQATGERLDRRQEGLPMLLTLRPVGVAHAVGFITYLVNPTRMAWSHLDLPAGLRWTGVAIGLVAAVLLVWTLVTLGTNLTDTVVTRKAHTLVTGGPYRWIRHPFYASVGLAMLANASAAANWFLFVTGVALMALFAVRTAREEVHLAARFGDSYRRYQARTGRFWPRWRRSEDDPR